MTGGKPINYYCKKKKILQEKVRIKFKYHNRYSIEQNNFKKEVKKRHFTVCKNKCSIDKKNIQQCVKFMI